MGRQTKVRNLAIAKSMRKAREFIFEIKSIKLAIFPFYGRQAGRAIEINRLPLPLNAVRIPIQSRGHKNFPYLRSEAQDGLPMIN